MLTLSCVGWVSDNDEESAQLEEELRLVLLSCPQFSALMGEYSVLVEGDQLQVLRVGSAQQWRWTWSDVLWYCLGRDWKGWDREWQLEMKIREWVLLAAITAPHCTDPLLWHALRLLQVLHSRWLHLHMGRHLTQALLFSPLRVCPQRKGAQQEPRDICG